MPVSPTRRWARAPPTCSNLRCTVRLLETAPTRPSCTSWPTVGGVDELLASPLDRAPVAATASRCRGMYGTGPTRAAPTRLLAQRAAAGGGGGERASSRCPRPGCRHRGRMTAPAAAFRRWNPHARRPNAPPRARSRRRAEARLPELCGAAGPRKPSRPGRHVAEVREAVDFLRYYADRPSAFARAHRPARPTGERQRAAPDRPRRLGLHQPLELPRWRSSPARWRRRWPPATRCWLPAEQTPGGAGSGEAA